MAREGSETAAQREGSLWKDKPVAGAWLSLPGNGNVPNGGARNAFQERSERPARVVF